MEVTLRTARGQMPASLSRPAGAGPWPGVVVIHDAAGVTRDFHAQADWLASEGFLALAPDLFYWGGRWRCIASLFGDTGHFISDLDVARAWLAARPECTGRTGVIGFCMGGGFALVLAADHGIQAASVNYGALTPASRSALPRACPIVASYGGKDRWPGVLKAAPILESVLTEAGIAHDIKVYPEAGHGFLNNHDPRDLTRIDFAIARVIGAAYHEPSTRDARARILAFFRTHLSESTSQHPPS